MKSNTLNTTMIWVSSFLVFLYPVTLLAQAYSYSWVPSIMALLSLIVFVTSKKHINGHQGLKRTYWLIVSYFIVIIASWVWFGGPLKQLDTPNRVLLLLPIVAFFLAYPPNKTLLFLGLALGGLLSGAIAVYMHFGLNVRALGSLGYMPIQASGMAMTLGVLSLVGVFYALEKKIVYLAGLCGLGFCGGLSASLLSGGRGAWVVTPFVVIALFWKYRHLMSKKITVIGLLLVSIVGYLSYPMIEARIKAVTADFQSEKHGSSTARLELWRAAVYVGLESPIFGVGLDNITSVKQKLVDKGIVADVAVRYQNAHSQYLDALQKRGLIGLGSVLAMCLAPLIYFRRQYKRHKNTDTAYFAVMGMCHIVLLMGYFLTQSYLNHHSGILLYVTFTAIFMAMCTKKTELESLNDTSKPPSLTKESRS